MGCHVAIGSAVVSAFLPVADNVGLGGAGTDGRRSGSPQTGRRAGRRRWCDGAAGFAEREAVAVVVLRIGTGLVTSSVNVAVKAPRVQRARPSQFGAAQFRTFRPVLDGWAIAALLLLWLSGSEEVQLEGRRAAQRRRITVRLAGRMSHGWRWRRWSEGMRGLESYGRLDMTVVAQIDEHGRVDGRRSEATSREETFQAVVALPLLLRLLRRLRLMLLDVVVGGHSRAQWYMAGYFAQFAADFQRQSLNNLALANQKTQQLVRRPADWRKEPGTDEKERREREKERDTWKTTIQSIHLRRQKRRKMRSIQRPRVDLKRVALLHRLSWHQKLEDIVPTCEPFKLGQWRVLKLMAQKGAPDQLAIPHFFPTGNCLGHC